MLIIGLTGSIAMGKSTTGQQLRALGLPVHEADTCVHELLSPTGRAFKSVVKAFPSCVKDKKIDRAALGKLVFGHDQNLKKLEEILHPLVHEETKKWLSLQHRLGFRQVVLDIPLLFEGGRDRLCDVVMVVSAPAFVQRQRALARTGMTEERFNAILKLQLPDRYKRKHADIIIPTGLGRAFSFRALQRALAKLSHHQATKWPAAWS